MPFQVEHSNCVHFTKRKFPPEIKAGTQITKLHIHQTENPITDKFKIKTKGTPVFNTSIMGATLFMFRMGVFLMRQPHLPSEINNGVMRWMERLTLLSSANSDNLVRHSILKSPSTLCLIATTLDTCI
jgi:hypothetical protein